MRTKRIVACLLSAVLLAGALAGCGSGEASKAPAAASAASGGATGEKLADEQVITLGQPEARTLDSAQAADTASSCIIMNYSEGLFRFNTAGDGTSKMEKAGCTDYSISDDGLTYTFKLRENKWSDGKPVTAKDYVFAVKRLLDKDVGSLYAFFATGLVNGKAYNQGKLKDFSKVGVKAVDDMTVEYKLEKPDAAFLSKLGCVNFMPLREDIVSKIGGQYGETPEGMVFNGPFKLTEWTDKDTGKLEKNDQYWDAKNVHLTEIKLQTVVEQATADKLFQQGGLAQVNPSSEYLKKYKDLTKKGECQELYRPSDGGSTWISFRMDNKNPSGLMSNRKIRQAVGYALNNQKICTDIYSRYVPAYGFVPNMTAMGDSSWGKEANQYPWKADSDKYRDNKAELQKLFKEGLKELGKQSDDLGQYTLVYLCQGESSLAKQVQEYVQQQISQNLGVNVHIKLCSGWEEYGKQVLDGGWDISMNGWAPDYNEPMTFLDMWVTGGTSNYQMYNNRDYDALIAQAVATTDPEKRLEIYKKCEQKLHDDMVLVPTYYGDTYSYFQKNLRGYQLPLMAGTWDYKNAYLVAEE